MSCKVSVIMGIYNCASTLGEAIESIIFQTYEDWELILCDDGSTDGTLKVAHKYKEIYPDKIILIQNKKNLGLNATLNHCLKYVTGDYIARMDGDDISLPNRFEVEVNYLDRHQECAIVSCPMIYFDERGDYGVGTCIANPEARDFVKGTPFCHAPCMVRKEAFDAVNGYSMDMKTCRAEDYNLWFRMYAAGYKGHNLREALYKMRDDINAYHRRKFKYALNEMYVRITGYKMLNLSIKYYIYAVRPVIVSLVPRKIYFLLHQKKMNMQRKEN